MEKFKEIDEFYSECVQSFPEHLNVPDKILHFIHKQMTFIEKELGKSLIKVIYSTAITSQKHTYFSDNKRNLFKILRAFVEEAIEKKDIKTDLSVDELTTLLVQSSMGIIYHWCLSDDDNDNLQKSSATLMKIILDGLKS